MECRAVMGSWDTALGQTTPDPERARETAEFTRESKPASAGQHGQRSSGAQAGGCGKSPWHPELTGLGVGQGVRYRPHGPDLSPNSPHPQQR